MVHINPELPTDVRDSLREWADEYNLDWSPFFSALAGWLDGVDGPPDEVMLAAIRADSDAEAYEAAREAAADGGGSDVATDGGPRGAQADSAATHRTVGTPPVSRQSTTSDSTPADPLAGDAGDDASSGGSPAASAGAWDAGLDEAEVAVVESLVETLRDQGGAMGPGALDYQIPIGHMGDVEFDDVADPLAEHPAVETPSDGAYVVR